ncbi:PPM-type phosphatase domain-containing protein [Haematococcus lacustris]|uniref:PPM-type phosphatase domain-containing protein n=1 Tax=Haematococcus lacustris TaxID=44745 RepID=A0A699ZAD5_HAELA|nr:PPM-type phosphatase domain-containing protein [Haematococcus lacustris]
MQPKSSSVHSVVLPPDPWVTSSGSDGWGGQRQPSTTASPAGTAATTYAAGQPPLGCHCVIVRFIEVEGCCCRSRSKGEGGGRTYSTASYDHEHMKGSVLALADGVNWGEPARRAARCAVLGACAHLHQALAGLGSDPGDPPAAAVAAAAGLPGVPPEQGGRDRAAAGWQLLWPRVCRCGWLGVYQMVVLP